MPAVPKPEVTSSPLDAHHPRSAAHARLGGRYTVRVLEPSPPAITAPPFHADDPCSRASDNERLVVSPVATGDLSWSELVAARDDEVLTAWCRDRWLAAWRPLTRHQRWEATVTSLQLLAGHVLGPWRAARTGVAARTDLRWTRDGVGTPFCWDDQQLRLQGRTLVWQRRSEVTAFDPDTLGEACAFARLPDPLDPDLADLPLDFRAIAEVADWLAFVTLVAERLRATHGRPRDRLMVSADDLVAQVTLADRRLEATVGDPRVTLDGATVLTWTDVAGDQVAPVEAAEAQLRTALDASRTVDRDRRHRDAG